MGQDMYKETVYNFIKFDFNLINLKYEIDWNNVIITETNSDVLKMYVIPN